MTLAHVGAFLSGVGAVVTAIVSLRIVEKRMRRECAERIEEIKRALHEGYDLRE